MTQKHLFNAIIDLVMYKKDEKLTGSYMEGTAYVFKAKNGTIIESHPMCKAFKYLENNKREVEFQLSWGAVEKVENGERIKVGKKELEGILMLLSKK